MRGRNQMSKNETRTKNQTRGENQTWVSVGKEDKKDQKQLDVLLSKRTLPRL